MFACVCLMNLCYFCIYVWTNVVLFDHMFGWPLGKISCELTGSPSLNKVFELNWINLKVKMKGFWVLLNKGPNNTCLYSHLELYKSFEKVVLGKEIAESIPKCTVDKLSTQSKDPRIVVLQNALLGRMTKVPEYVFVRQNPQQPWSILSHLLGTCSTFLTIDSIGRRFYLFAKIIMWKPLLSNKELGGI